MNNDKEQEYEYDEEFDEKSKTRVKKEMHELHVLGEKTGGIETRSTGNYSS